MKKWVMVTIFTSVMMFACRPPVEEAAPEAEEPAAVEADLEAINQLRDDYSAANNAGDAVATAGLFTDDAILMPPNEAAVVGKEAIQSNSQARFDEFKSEHGATSEEIELADQWAYGRGSYTLKLTPKAEGEALEDSGKYLVIVERQPDGSWRIARLIWNSNKPLAQAEGE